MAEDQQDSLTYTHKWVWNPKPFWDPRVRGKAIISLSYHPHLPHMDYYWHCFFALFCLKHNSRPDLTSCWQPKAKLSGREGWQNLSPTTTTHTSGFEETQKPFGGSRPIYHQSYHPQACWVMIMIITLTTNKKKILKQNSDAEDESSVACTCKRGVWSISCGFGSCSSGLFLKWRQNQLAHDDDEEPILSFFLPIETKVFLLLFFDLSELNFSPPDPSTDHLQLLLQKLAACMQQAYTVFVSSLAKLPLNFFLREFWLLKISKANDFSIVYIYLAI